MRKTTESSFQALSAKNNLGLEEHKAFEDLGPFQYQKDLQN